MVRVGKTLEKIISSSYYSIFPESVHLDLSLLSLLLLFNPIPPPPPPLCFEKSSLLYLETRAHRWPRKIRVLRVPVLEKGPRYVATKIASLLHSRSPSNSDLLVCCCEGGLHSGKVLRRGELVAFLLSSFLSFLLLFWFFCLSTALLIPTSSYSIEQDNMRDQRDINEKDCESFILAIKNIENSTEMHA